MDGHNKLRSYFWGLQRLVANIVCHLIAVGFQTYGEIIYNICPSEGREYKDTEFPSLQTEELVFYLYHGLKRSSFAYAQPGLTDHFIFFGRTIVHPYIKTQHLHKTAIGSFEPMAIILTNLQLRNIRFLIMLTFGKFK
ncbi:MAG: hypothetical protein IKW05_02790 [Muribaculaceae bacterium]|nr:hypothetical protein [Muribaculaceae bacterium]